VSGFLQVPEAALDLAADWQDRCIVFGLYELADEQRFGPFKASSRMLRARFGGASGRRVEAIVKAMVAEGLIQVEREGTPRTPRVLRVLRWKEWVALDGASVPETGARNAGGNAGGNAPVLDQGQEQDDVPSVPDDDARNAGRNAGGNAHRARSSSRPQTSDSRENPPPPAGVGSPSPIPKWVPSQTGGQARREVGDGVLRVLAEISGRPCRALDIEGDGRDIKPSQSKAAAKPILSLLRALDWPDMAEFVRHACLVARAARSCPHPMFARDIRAEGWDAGTDRRRRVTTLMVQDRWDDRLVEALRWREAGEPRGAPRPRAGPSRRPTAPTAEDWLTTESLGLDAPLPYDHHGDDHGHRERDQGVPRDAEHDRAAAPPEGRARVA